MKKYGLPENYQCNLTEKGFAIPYCNDEEGSSIYQVKVYEYVRKIIHGQKFKNLCDIGCGFGVKLEKIVNPVCKDIVGIDTAEAAEYCRRKYNFGKWYADDIENSSLTLRRKFDLLLSSDVIEHMVDPDNLLRYIQRFSHTDSHIIISTPERDKIVGQNSSGPPMNASHVREWNQPELKAYLQSRGFRIKKHFLVGEKNPALLPLLKNIVFFRPIRRIQVIHCTLA